MIKKESMIIEQAFAKEIGVSIYAAMKILNTAGISTEEISDISNVCKNILVEEIEKRDIPHESRFLLLSLILCRMLKTSTEFHKEFMKSVERLAKLPQDILTSGDDCQDIEIAKDP
jgi:hypothetical protein